MLRSLHIENYALIRSLQIEFDQGFTVITGETGAGKSILLGALSLITGQRADTSMLFDKSSKCFVEAEVEIRHLQLQPFFDTHNLDYSDQTILRREINSAGKSRAFINDTPVNLALLKELADVLIDIHSQHQHLLINNALFRIQIVDDYAANHSLLAEYQKIFHHHEKISTKLHELRNIQKELDERKDYLSFLSNELHEADLKEVEEMELKEKISMLSNAETIKSTLYNVNQKIADQEINIISQLKEVIRDCDQLCNYSTDLSELNQRLHTICIDIQDISYSLSQIESRIEVDPAQLEFFQQRLDLLYSLLQKHHVDNISELIDKQKDIDIQLQSIENSGEQIESLEKELRIVNDELLKKSDLLTKNRLAVSEDLQNEIMSKLKNLGMPDAHFHIDIEQRNHFSEIGRDRVSFYFSANKGAPPEEIGKIASGGELSRMMLAIKSIITESRLLPTVIFDEIDSGISGEIAGKVAKIMSELSLKHQLLAITHLPQIAAKGTLHYHVYKEVIQNQTYTNIRKLTTEERIEEIAKMMSDETVTSSALDTAKVLMGIKR